MRMHVVLPATLAVVATIIEIGIATSVPDFLSDVTLGGLLLTLLMTGLGSRILTRHPRHDFGRLMVWIGIVASLVLFVGSLLEVLAAQHLTPITDSTEIASLDPATNLLLWVVSWLWAPMILPVLTLLFLYFPDGRPTTRLWRTVEGVALCGIAFVTLAQLVGYWPWQAAVHGQPPATLGDDPWGPLGFLDTPGFVLVFLAMPLSIVSVVVRFRSATGIRRQQLRAGMFGAAMAALGFGTSTAWLSFFPTDDLIPFLIQPVAVACIATSLGLAVLRYRLYDIDLVLNKTLVFAVLAAFITGVYAVVVVWLGGLVPSDDLLRSITATAIVAVGFEPIRQRVQRWANRVVYGPRATPYEVLSRMSSRVETATSPHIALQDLATLLAEGTGASQVVVWLGTDDRLQPSAVAPDPSIAPVAFADADLAVDVRHDTRRVGAITLVKAAGEAPSTADSRLVQELAGQAALLLATSQLRSRLGEKAEELRDSRRRLVAAQDEARHRLERNLHDGAQQELVALKVKLGLARTIAGREGAQAYLPQLERASVIADRAVERLRDLARGIYPPLLEAEGLAAALRAQMGKVTVAVTVLDKHTRRLPRAVEATTYFCVLEAVANADVHAGADLVQVVLDVPSPERFVVVVTDDGCGFDRDAVAPGDGLTTMADRVDALGGSLVVRSRPGHGTTVTIDIPVVPSVLEDAETPRQAPAAAGARS